MVVTLFATPGCAPPALVQAPGLWSGRASKANQRFSSPGYVVVRPQHRSATPINASTYSVGYLTRQDARQESWFRHLDFVKVADGDIKKIFWTGFMEKKFREYVPVPLAMQRDPQI